MPHTSTTVVIDKDKTFWCKGKHMIVGNWSRKERFGISK